MNKEQIVDYLYGGLDEGTRERFELEIAQNPALAQELEELRQVRRFLNQSEDIEPANVTPTHTKKRITFLSRWWSVAATVLFLMIAGKLLGIQLEMDAQGILLSYGSPTERMLGWQEMDIKELVAKLEELDDKIETMPDTAAISAMLAGQMARHSGSNKIPTADLKSLRSQQADLARQTSDQIQLQQQAYIQEVVNDLIQYWDARRTEEIQLINAGLDNIAQTIQFNDKELLSFQSSENL